MEVELTAPDWAKILISDLTDWHRAPIPVSEMQPFELPDDAYFEYAYLDAGGTPRPDPDNPNPPLNPWWEWARNLCGPDYRPDPFADVGDTRPRGQVLRQSIASQILGQQRRYIVYTPAGHVDEELPLVLFQDGKAYYGWGKVPQVCDRLLEAGRIIPAHLVFVPPMERAREYAFNPDYRRFLVEELLPAVEGRTACNGQRTAWGASLGGLLSAMLAVENPEIFQSVVSQSGSFLFSPLQLVNGDPFHGDEWFLNTVLLDHKRVRQNISGLSEPSAGEPAFSFDRARLVDLRWYLDCGKLEWFRESNRRVVAALEAAGCVVDYQERTAGHNWMNWRNGLAPALQSVLGT